jgi:hypothetical protein
MGQAVSKEDLGARLIVRRDLESDIDVQRQISVTLDGEKQGSLMKGQMLTLQVSAGHHKLKFDNTWDRKTVEFDANDGEQIEYRVENEEAKHLGVLLWIFGGMLLDVRVERVVGDRQNPVPAS